MVKVIKIIALASCVCLIVMAIDTIWGVFLTNTVITRKLVLRNLVVGFPIALIVAVWMKRRSRVSG